MTLLRFPLLIALALLPPVCPTLAYAQAGMPLWTNVANSAGAYNDIPTGIAVNSAGNVFVTGYAVDGSFSTSGYLTVGYSGDGLPLWTNRFDGIATGWDTASAIAADAQGNIFVTGASTGNGSGSDFTTLKYSGNGMPLWTNRYNGPYGTDNATALCIDSDGNVYVTGESYDPSLNNIYATAKYSNSGVESWARRYTAGKTDYPYAIAADTNGNVFVTGFSVGNGTQTDFATIKYSSTGSQTWVARYNGPGNSSDEAHAIAVSPSGNVCVTGISVPDLVTIQYSNQGVPMWTNRYHGPSSGAYGKAIAVDTNGNVFVAGYTYGINYSDGFVLLKYSSAGVPLWTNRHAGSAVIGDTRAYSVAVDKIGNAYIAGYVTGVGGTVIAYSSNGVGLWTNQYPAYPTYAPLALDRDGNVFVAGAVSSGPGIGSDYMTIKYSALSPSPIPLHITRANNDVILSWADARFDLQSAPSLGGSFTNILGATSPCTNSLTGAQQFFRLRTQ